MWRGSKSVVRHLVLISVILASAERGRADAGVAAGGDGLLAVVVADAVSGRPIGKASVDIRRADGVSCGSIVSDANGVAWVHLDPGRYEVCGPVSEGYTYEGQRQTVAVAPGEPRQVGMGLTPNLHGIAHDPRGAPVADAWVRVIGAGREEATSDWQGGFGIAWDRRCQLREASTFFLVARQERRNLAALVEIGREASELDVRLQPSATLTGRIVDPNGRAIADAWVYVMLEAPNWGPTPLGDEQTKVDSDGRFEIRAVPTGARYTLYAYADGYGCRNVVVQTRSIVERSLDVGPLTLPTARLSVTGRVLDTQGDPVPHALVYGWGEGQPLRLNAQTDAEGTFTFTGVCAGRIDLRVDADWGRGEHRRAQLLADAGDSSLQIISLRAFAR